jgi:hypothetical protein
MLGDEEIVASDAQIRANRLNAQRSTGPRSENGKQAVRYQGKPFRPCLRHTTILESRGAPT